MPKALEALSTTVQELFISDNPLSDSAKQRIKELFKVVDL
jgi:hypothetical protein